MKLYFNQLEDHLRSPLAPMYFLHGDEPWQIMTAADTIRRHAREQGFTERQLLQIEKGFDWGVVQAAAASMSLFADRQMIDLRMPTGKPGVEGSKVLQAYAQDPPPDTLLLIQAGKLEKGVGSAAWAKALERAGVVLQVWPLDVAATRKWIINRFRGRGITVGADVAGLITERVEGNLLAAAQEVDKLTLIASGGSLDLEAAVAAVANSSRFTVFGLADASLSGDQARSVKILQGLREEGMEPVLVLWALSREVRELVAMAGAMAGGAPLNKVLAPVWQKRKNAFGSALQRGSSDYWQRLLRHCAHVDRVTKGQAYGSAWDELLQLTLAIAGRPLFDNESLAPTGT